jgi:exosortase/archaeosortase family protein
LNLSHPFSFLRGNGALAFVARSCLLLVALGLVSLSPQFGRWVEAPLIQLDATLTHHALRILGIETVLEGRRVVSPRFSIEVIPECTGIFPLVILVALTLAYPVAWRRKLAGLALGSTLIFVMNLVRLVTLFLVGIRFSQAVFEDVHLYVWQSFFVIAVAVYWFAWARKSVVAREPAGD